MTVPTCHPDRPHSARGLCASCYNVAWKYGRLTTPRTTRSRADFVADYVHLRADGLSHAAIARRLGMTPGAVSVAYRRAVAAGALTPDRRPA